jgi:DNA-binding NarL/FixJ family response regulator
LTRKIAILVAEDDPQTLQFTEAVIKTALPGVVIHTATNTEEALDLFSKHNHDIIVSDHKMPNHGDGVELAKEICKAKPEAAFFFRNCR